jgi:hypothetical protein
MGKIRSSGEEPQDGRTFRGETSLSRRSYMGGPTLFAFGASIALLCISGMVMASAASGAPVGRKVSRETALGGFVKDTALARLLGETLFHDTVEVMSDSGAVSAIATPAGAAADQSHDNSAAGQVARTVLAHRSLDKYLWLIQQAYDDVLWKGGDRTHIEQHFPLIWRTSIMLYEATLNASPHRVRVCAPSEDIDTFDCRDEVGRTKIIPIPAQAPLLVLLHQPNIG